MSIIDIKMKKIYGLNKYDDELNFKSDVKHNFIYGVNAVGKTSFSKGIELLIENKQYKKLMEMDSNEYHIKFNFDNLNEIMDNTLVYKNKSNFLNKRLFVFTKRYLNQHVSLVNSDNSNIQIGIRIAEREKYINEVDAIIESLQKSIFEKIKTAKLKTTKEGFVEESNILKLKSTLKDKSKERDLKQNAFESLLHEVGSFQNGNSHFLNIGDFNGKNLKIMNDLTEVLKKIIVQLDAIINKNIQDNLYEIKNIDDKDFYSYIIKYLKKQEGLTYCPVCKNNEFDLLKVINNIESSLNNLLKDEIISEFDKHYKKLEENDDSLLYNNIKNIYDNLLNSKVDKDLINQTIISIEDLNNNYDYYLLKFIDFDTANLPRDEYNNKVSLIKEINQQNNEYSENDLFITELNKMLDYVFENDEFKAEKFEYSENGNNYYGIQLIINGIMKKGISIEDFWSEILSESQKTKISLAFLFAVVIFNNYDGKILCIFDDPIDSYDSLNKYKMSRIIYEFINKKGKFEDYKYDCYDLIFSHSIEYLRLFNENLNSFDNSNVLYWVMSKNNITEIKKEDLFLLRGDFHILNHLIKESNKSNLILSLNDFISLTPIIRELSSITKKAFDTPSKKTNIDNNEIYKLDEFISENVVHGYNKNIIIKDLIDFVKKYINITIDNQYQSENIFDYIKNYIDSNINNVENMSFYEQIFFKNVLSIYIRAKYDYELACAIKQYISKYNNKSLDDIHNENREISKKVAIIYKDINARKQNIDLLMKISKARPMLNDFAHSANIFLTPLIDVTLNELKNIYDSAR